MRKYRVGDRITLKKGHPCGANDWRIVRTGVDIRLECMGCHREIWLPRLQFDKRIRKIRTEDGTWISIVHYEPTEKEEENETV